MVRGDVQENGDQGPDHDAQDPGAPGSRIDRPEWRPIAVVVVHGRTVTRDDVAGGNVSSSMRPVGVRRRVWLAHGRRSSFTTWSTVTGPATGFSGRVCMKAIERLQASRSIAPSPWA